MQNLHCFHCHRSSDEAPLIQLTYQGKYRWVCPQCMPALIHKPESVMQVLSNPDKRE